MKDTELMLFKFDNKMIHSKLPAINWHDPFWGRYFWARGDFCATVGQMLEDMTKDYLEHHLEPKKNDGFKIEPD